MSGVVRPVRAWLELGPLGAASGGSRGDVVVIIDALRASVTVAAGLKAGARRVIPVLTVEEARAYLGDPGCRVAGERGGAKLPEFDFGNSPTEILAHQDEVRGRTLVLTTSNGTRCVNAALGGAAAVLIGSTVNASAAASAAVALARAHQRDVTLVAAGLGGQAASEDAFAQRLIAARLVALGAVLPPSVAPVDEAEGLRVFLDSKAAGGLTRLGYVRDVHFCAQIDAWESVPVYRADGFYSLSPSDPSSA